MTPRHFLDIDRIEASHAPPHHRHGARHEEGRQARAGQADARGHRRRRADADLREALDAHAGVVRRGDAPARRPVDRAQPHRLADRPRRAHIRHRQGAVALRRRHHGARQQARNADRARRARHRAGDQRADRPDPPLPDRRRHHDVRGEAGTDQGAQDRLERRRQQRGGIVDPGRRAGSASSCRWPARRSSTRSGRCWSGPGATAARSS